MCRGHVPLVVVVVVVLVVWRRSPCLVSLSIPLYVIVVLCLLLAYLSTCLAISLSVCCYIVVLLLLLILCRLSSDLCHGPLFFEYYKINVVDLFLYDI